MDRPISAPDHKLTPETVWQIQLPRIRVGRDAVDELPHQVTELGVAPEAEGVLITDETLVELGHAARVRGRLESAGFGIEVFDGVEREPSIRSVRECLSFVRERQGEAGYDFYLGLGGGSCMDTAKAVRTMLANDGVLIEYISEPTGDGRPLSETGDPLVLLPTTAGTGAEISPVAILDVEDQDIDEAIANDHVRADAVVLDPTLTTTLPPDITAQTAMDALGQAIEGYTTHSFDSLLRATNPASRPVYAGRTPLTEMCSEKAIRLLSSNVRQAVHNGDNLEARSNMLLGALFGGIAALTAGSNLCHAMSYPVANKFHTYHGETIAVLTPASTLDYNVGSDPEQYARVAELLGVNVNDMSARDAAREAKRAFVRLQRDLNVLPSGLHELAGVREDEVDELARHTIETQKRLLRCNPRRVSEEDVRGVYRDALHNW